jgi:NDP-sugar pyrophosphorylase family protein/aminoglycoside/choline kinase family phosphotransferase
MNPINIFIPAAGLGERLKPMTNFMPKPLLPILGKPVLEYVLEKISALPVQKIGINLHHKKEDIERWIKQSAFNGKIELFTEDPLLGTGGALKNAEGFLKNSAFLVHNSDILSDIDLTRLIDHHLSSANLGTLAVHDYPEFNRLILNKNGLIEDIIKHPHPYPPPSRGREVEENTPPSSGRESSGIPPFSDNSLPLKIPPSPGGRGLEGGGYKILAFTGIAAYQPEFLQFLPKGNSSVVDAWRKAIDEGYKIGTFDVTGCRWTDIGTPASYAKAVIAELRENGETVYLHPSVKSCEHIRMDGYVVIENISNPPSPPFSKGEKGGFSDENLLNQNIFLKNCIVLPGTKIEIKDREDAPHSLSLAKDTPPSPPCQGGAKGGCLFENCILGPGFKIDLSESDLFASINGKAFLIGTGGSDRRYYRVRKGSRSAVLMQCQKDDPDFERQIEYTHFFRKYSVPVPELLRADAQKKSASFEDLGDLSLYSWLKCPREKKQKEKVYRQVIEILFLIHTVATEHVSECPLLHERIFDYEYLRWETDYFIERFVCGIRNIRIRNLAALKDEFHRLAARVDSFRKTIIHRDFQSQNIMITRGEIPRILDYQGARIGPSAYDLASILWDPYYRLEDDLRERLLDYYIHRITNPPQYPFGKGGLRGIIGKGGQGRILEKQFRDTILPCRLQRHMQALGAYGFLSSVKGKKYFLKYVPEALRLLKEDLASAKKEFPLLDALVRKL